MNRILGCLVLGVISTWGGNGMASLQAGPIAGFRPSPWGGEQTLEWASRDDYRVLIQAPLDFDPRKPTRLILYATPNGNTIEQTLGCALSPGIDWHFDIQHASAQVRTLRPLRPGENLVLACLEAKGLSWPTWKRTHPDAPQVLLRAVETIRSSLGTKDTRLVLAGHSGGGSLVLGCLESDQGPPPNTERILLLDANYSYSDELHHGDRLVDWLKGDAQRRLVVIAYDDREITLDGKKVIGPQGGTFRATERMHKRLSQAFAFQETQSGPYLNRVSQKGQIHLLVHKNPENKILHTALVGEMNGLLHGLTIEESPSRWGTWGGPRAYSKAIQNAPALPNRPVRPMGGVSLFQSWEGLSRAKREEAIQKEIVTGNFPEFLRNWSQITYKARGKSGKEHEITLECMPDYLSVGTTDDFVRVPINPITASYLADAFGCQLPTRFLVDKIHSQAKEILKPIPLTKNREESATFLEHHRLIETQRSAQAPRGLISGIKKDLVVTNRLEEKPNRVALYGWHQDEGKPIQPLNISHVNWYVDYSHGVRLIKRTVLVDGKPRDIRQLFVSDEYAPCFCDEGILRRMTY